MSRSPEFGSEAPMRRSLPGSMETKRDGEIKTQLLRFADAVKQNWWLIAITLIVAGIAAVVATSYQTPLYQSTATVLFTEPRAGLSLSEQGPATSLGGEGSSLDTDMAVMNSRQVAMRAAEILGFNVVFHDSAVRQTDLFNRVTAIGDVVVPGTYRLARRDGGFRLTDMDGQVIRDSVEPGETVVLGGVRIVFSDRLLTVGQDEIVFDLVDLPAAADGLRGAVTIMRIGGPARVATITHRNTDPVLAAAVPNAFAQAFIERKAESGRSVLSDQVAFLESQVDDYAQDLIRAEDALRDYRSRTRVIDLEAESTEQVARLTEFQIRRDTLEADRAALDRLLREAESDVDSPISPYRQLASFPDLFSNQVVQDLFRSLTEVENDRSELLARRTPGSLDIQALDQRIDDLESQLYQMAVNYRSSLASQIDAAEAGIERISDELGGIPSRELDYDRLAREQAQVAEMYSILEQRLKESEIQLAAQQEPVEVLDPALVPRFPVSPQPRVNLMLGLLAGLLAGLAIVYLRSRLDDTLRRPEEVHFQAALPLLGTIPVVGAEKAGTIRRLQNGGSANGLQPVIVRGSGEAAALPNGSLAVEAYRGLRDSISGISGMSVRTLVVTSVAPGDGKSTTAANLAISFSEQGWRTLLVDGDLRAGQVRKLFGSDRSRLVPLEANMSPFGEIVRVEFEGMPNALHILAANPAQSSDNIDRDLRSLAESLPTLGEQFDVVIVDAPPIGLFSDARILANPADGVLLVARIGNTSKEGLEAAAQQVVNLPAPVRGIALNGVPASKLGYAYTA